MMAEAATRRQVAPIAGFVGYNLLLLVLLFFSDFDAVDFLAVVYVELCVLGGFSMLAILASTFFGHPFESETTSVNRGLSILLGLLVVAFFVIKFGGLMIGLAAVLLFLPELIDVSWIDLRDPHPYVEICLWALLIRYGIEFLWFFLIKREYRQASILKLVFAPYLNGMWAMLTIGVGIFFAARSPDEPGLQFTIGVVLAKLFFDLFSLLFQLRRDRRSAPQN